MNTRDVHFKNRPTGKEMKSRLNSDIELVGKEGEETFGSKLPTVREILCVFSIT